MKSAKDILQEKVTKAMFLLDMEEVNVIVEAMEEYAKSQVDLLTYTKRDVGNIFIEMTNATMYGHSHNLTRFELHEKLRQVKIKWIK